MLAFLAVLALAYAVPGPDLAVITAAARRGRALGVRTAAGVMAGLTTHATLAAVGLSALAARTPGVLDGVRVLGTAYLLWLGLKLLRAARAPAAQAGGRVPAPVGGLRTGFTTNITNPKTVLFFLSLLPLFAHGQAEIAALAAATVVYGAVWWTLVVLGVQRLASWLERPEVARRVDGLTGGVLVAMAALVLTSA